MKKYVPRVFVIIYLAIIALAFLGTIYATFITQNFAILGVYSEITEEGMTYVDVYHKGEYYEFEIDSTDTNEVLAQIAETVGIDPSNLDRNYYTAVDKALDEATAEYEDDGMF